MDSVVEFSSTTSGESDDESCESVKNRRVFPKNFRAYKRLQNAIEKSACQRDKKLAAREFFIAFDYDGTLVNTESTIQAFISLCQPSLRHPFNDYFNGTVPSSNGWFTVWDELMQVDKIYFKQVIDDFKSEMLRCENIDNDLVDLFIRLFGPLNMIAIVTNSVSELIKAKFENIPIVARNTQLSLRPKPSPDMYIGAALFANLSDETIRIAFEDSKTGISSAQAAGYITFNVTEPLVYFNVLKIIFSTYWATNVMFFSPNLFPSPISDRSTLALIPLSVLDVIDTIIFYGKPLRASNVAYCKYNGPSISPVHCRIFNVPAKISFRRTSNGSLRVCLSFDLSSSLE
jgi:phosphoglycolate phosphatase-like HAD superfamily hydrolase